MSVRLAVFASGGGTNLQALLDHFEGGRNGARVALVISDNPDAGALDRAKRAEVATHVIPVRGRPTAAVTADAVDALESTGIELVTLAGYMQLVPEEVVGRFSSRIVNVHPALLPAFGGRGMYGARVHRAVLQAGCTVTGATVHLVNERYDEGRILSQWPVPVLEGDTPDTLARRVLRTEHALYPATVEWLARVMAAARGQGGVGAGTGAGGSGTPAVPSAAATDGGGFRMSSEWEPDRAGIRRMLGLD